MIAGGGQPAVAAPAPTSGVRVLARLSRGQPWAADFARQLQQNEALRAELGNPRQFVPALAPWNAAVSSVLDLREAANDPRFGALRWVEFEWPGSETAVQAIVDGLSRNPRFDLIGIEKPAPVQFAQSSVVNDPLYAFNTSDPHKHQWALDQGRFRQAFGFTEGSALVGILDQGINPDHPDLVPNLRRHMTASVDRFEPQAAPAVHGYFPQVSVYGESNPATNAGSRVAHGLHVAGTVGAVKDSQGTSGACPRCSLTVLRTMQSTEIARGMLSMLNHGATAVSMSFSMTTPSSLGPNTEQRLGVALMLDYLNLADLYDTALVGSMGNNLTFAYADNTVVFPFPAALPFVIGVGATDIRTWRWEELLIADQPLDQRHPMTNYSNEGSSRVAARCTSSVKRECGSNYGQFVRSAPFNVQVTPTQFTTFPAGTYGINVVAPGAQVLSTIDRVYSPFACYDAAIPPASLPLGALRCQPIPSPAGAFPPNNFSNQAPARNDIGNAGAQAYAGVPYALDPSYDNVPANSPLPATYAAYGVMTGTSMAAPHVAAQAGLIRSANPLLRVSHLRGLITSGASRAAMAIPPGRSPWTSDEVGSGLVNAEDSVKRTLGVANGVQLRNRLTPVFGLTSTAAALGQAGAGPRAWLYTTSPQVAMAAIEGRHYYVVDSANAAGPPNSLGQTLPASSANDFGIAQSVSYLGSRSAGVGYDIRNYYDFNVLYRGAGPNASFLLFTTPYDVRLAQADALKPLYRMSMKCNQIRKHFYSVDVSEVSTYSAGPTSCGSDAAPSAQGYNLDGIEGYLIPVNAAGSLKDAEGLYRKYSPTDKAWALVLESEETHPAYTGYTQNRTLLGYVYPIIKDSSTSPSIVDADADGLFDVIERRLLGTNPALWDTDGDGAPDGVEYPLDALSTDPRLP